MSSSLQKTETHNPAPSPIITVGVLTYNRPKLLKECISSILCQTYQKFNILIANDCVSSPVTFESLEIPQDSRIKIVNHMENIGAYQNNYYLIKNASGDWFTWLADDDLMHPRFLEYAYQALSDSDALSFYSSYAAGKDSVGWFDVKKNTHGELSVMNGFDFIEEYAARRIRAVGCYGVFKRQIWGAISLAPRFGNGLAAYVDGFIPLVVAQLGPIAYRNFDLVFLRTHAASQSASSCQIDDFASAQKDFLVEFRKRFKSLVSKHRYDTWRRDFIWWFAQDGWHVIIRAFDSIFHRLIAFFEYYIRTLVHHVPLKGFMVFQFKVVFLVLNDAVRQAICKAKMRISPSKINRSLYS